MLDFLDPVYGVETGLETIVELGAEAELLQLGIGSTVTVEFML